VAHDLQFVTLCIDLEKIDCQSGLDIVKADGFHRLGFLDMKISAGIGGANC
jgi:hypothetical protein